MDMNGMPYIEHRGQSFLALDPASHIHYGATLIEPSEAWLNAAARSFENAKAFSVHHNAAHGVLYFEGLAPIALSHQPVHVNKHDGPNELMYHTNSNAWHSFFDATLAARAIETGMNINDVGRFVMFVNRMLESK